MHDSSAFILVYCVLCDNKLTSFTFLMTFRPILAYKSTVAHMSYARGLQHNQNIYEENTPCLKKTETTLLMFMTDRQTDDMLWHNRALRSTAR